MFGKKKKLIDFFVVTPFYDFNEAKDLGNIQILTLTETEKDCEEYINNRLRIENRVHFSSWCSLHQKDVNANESWQEYMNLGIVDITKYYISKVSYTHANIAAILRMFNHCVPVGCNYDLPEEYNYLINQLPIEIQNDLESMLEEEIGESVIDA